MAIRRKNVNERALSWIEGRLSTEEFFEGERKRAREIAERSIDARIAKRLAERKA